MLAFLAIMGSCNNNKTADESGAAFSSSNPFFKASELPFQAPAFDKIKNGDFKPALEEGMKQQMVEIKLQIKQRLQHLKIQFWGSRKVDNYWLG